MENRKYKCIYLTFLIFACLYPCDLMRTAAFRQIFKLNGWVSNDDKGVILGKGGDAQQERNKRKLGRVWLLDIVVTVIKSLF